jgi:hypothetical protein
VAFTAQEICAGGAIEVNADTAGFEFFFLGGFHRVFWFSVKRFSL